jgi:arylsulfatase A-like enzyme
MDIIPDQQSSQAHTLGLGGWFRAALITFALVGSLEWLLAATSSTAAGFGGLVGGMLVIVSIWVLCGSVWALGSGIVLKIVSGRASGAFLVTRLVDQWKQWWAQRHSERDLRRLATFVSVMVALAAFAAASLGLTAYLIDNRHGSWLIAAASLVGQVVLAVIVITAAFGLRRYLLMALVWLQKTIWPQEKSAARWLHTPALVMASVLLIAGAAVFGLVTRFDIFLAVDGPSLALIAAAIVAHPWVAYFLRRRKPLHAGLRRALWAAPLLAVVVAAVASRHAESRRLLALHGASANYVFNTLQRHVDLDQIFQSGGDCPSLDPWGRPPDGMSYEEYNARCLDPAYEQPVARTEVPAFERPELEQRPSFLFITWDSVRVDRLGYMGHERNTTPNLDAFAEQSLVFNHAFAQDSGTGPSFWSLLAGKTPFQVDLPDATGFPPKIGADEKMLGELLQKAGYQTEAVMCGSVFDTSGWGIKRGFDRFENICGKKKRDLAPIVADDAVETMQRVAGLDKPFFLWVHFYDVHGPYSNHPEIGYGDERVDNYDEELRYTDTHFQRLLDIAKKVADTRPLYTVFGADHGENFGEHGSDPHARNLYRIVTQVPMIIHGPNVESRRVDAPVAFNDVYPTVLDLAGIPVPEESTMVSQVPVLFGAEADDKRMIFQENSYSRPRRHTRAVVYDRFHYIMDLTMSTNELYDYVDDPLERENLIGAGLVEEQVMHQALLRFLKTSHIPEGLRD